MGCNITTLIDMLVSFNNRSKSYDDGRLRRTRQVLHTCWSRFYTGHDSIANLFIININSIESTQIEEENHYKA